MAFFDHPDTPYTGVTFLDNLPAYTTAGAASAFDLAKEIELSGKYYTQWIAFPDSSRINITARDTLSGVITVPPLSYVIGLTGDCYSTEDPVLEDAEIQVRLYDKGAKMDSFINQIFIRRNSAFPRLANTRNIPQGIYLIRDPFVLLRPGNLQIEVTNLSAGAIIGQVNIMLAVPVNEKSIGEVLLTEGRNQLQ